MRELIKKPFVKYVVVFLLTFSIYLINTPEDFKKDTLKQTHSNLLPSADAVPNTFLPFLLYKHNTFDFSPIAFHLRRFDSNKKIQYYISQGESGRYSSYPVLTGLIAYPFYIIPLALNKIPTVTYHENILKILLIGRVAAAFYSAVSVSLLYAILRKIDRKSKLLYPITTFFALGTSMWTISSRELWTHTLVVTILCTTILLLIQTELKVRSFFIIGLLCGLIIATRQTTAVIAILIGLYVLYKHKKYVIFYTLGALIPTIPLLIYNKIAFGGILSSGYEARGDIKWTTPILEGLAGQLFTPGKGILIISPLLLLSFYAIFRVYRDKYFGAENNLLYRFISPAVIIYILMYSKWYGWDGGSSFGYRFMTDVLPIMVILTYETLKNLKGKKLIPIYLLIFYSVCVQANAVFYLKSTCKPHEMRSTECIYPRFLEKYQNRQ